MAYGELMPVWTCIPGVQTEITGPRPTGGCPGEASGFGIAKKTMYVLDPSSQEKIEALLETGPDPFGFLNLTVDQGAQIGGAILMLWAVAWGIRQIRQHLETIDEGMNREN